MSANIYTIGLGQKDPSTVTRLLHSAGVNCVVDIVAKRAQGMEDDSSHSIIVDALRQEGITHLSFFAEFGYIPFEAQNKYGKPVYSKVIKQSKFLQGIERLKNGLAKGYTIAIMDSEDYVYNSKRHNIIGKYLDSIGIKVFHIENDGTIYSFDKVNEIIARKTEIYHKNKADAIELGKNGEEIAALHLMRKGHTILDRNWNLHHGCELDLITRKDGVIYFVEVKTRRSVERGSPHLAIDRNKLRNIMTALREYRYKYCLQEYPYQIMSVAIVYRSEDDYDIDFLKWGDVYVPEYSYPDKIDKDKTNNGKKDTETL